MEFGTRLHELRLQKSLTQEELAGLANLDRTYISGVERGKRNISLNAIKSISVALEIPLHELFKEM